MAIKEQMLAKVPLFAGLTAKELDHISSLLTQLDVPAGTTLIRQGEVGKEFMVIVKGTVEVVHNLEVLRTLGEGDHFGEIALLDGGRRTASVVAKTPVTIEVASQQEFLGLLNEAPEIAVKLLPALARRVRELNAHAVDVS